MKRAARIDANQNEIVAALRGIGATVAITSTLGKGFPDLVVGYRGKNYLLEIKDGNKPPSARKLTDDEQQWHECWRGQVAVIESPHDAMKLVTQ